MRPARDALGRVAVAARLLCVDVLRRRVTLLLLFVVPALFDAVVVVTTAERPVDVTLGSIVEEGAEIVVPGKHPELFDLGILEDGRRTLDERALSLVFLGGAAVCFLTCFLAFHLAHRRREVDRRLVLAGYRAWEVLAAKLVVLVVLVAALAAYETAIIWPLLEPLDLGRVALGYFLGGLVYAGVGLCVGSLARQELSGIFAIVLLTNIDVGWLQNPVYYAHSAERAIIEGLPGFYPTQIAVCGAFTPEAPPGAVPGALLYAAVAIAAALLGFWLRIRTARPRAAA